MILKIQLCLVVVVAWINKATCASVSKVYVQSGVDSSPLEYYQYGAPWVAYASPQIAQLSAAPENSVVPVSSGFVTPCVAPCVYPGQTIASFAPVPSNANIVSYQSPVPNRPIATSNWNEPARYAYEYFVYDQNTGDKKSQSEMSDGSMVRGEYSFLQPDGYVREVKYVADDIKGFNAIVTNYLPATEDEIKSKTTEETKPTPCPQVKSEPIKHIDSASETETSSEEKHELSEELESETYPKANGNHVEGANMHKETSNKGEEKVKEGSKENISSTKSLLSKEMHNTRTQEGYETNISIPQKSTETLADASILIPYKDIMKCIESLISKATLVQTESPLAYIVLNRPC